MKRRNLIAYLMVALFAIVLSACGGDGDSNTTASSQWDTMKWDQGKWK